MGGHVVLRQGVGGYEPQQAGVWHTGEEAERQQATAAHVPHPICKVNRSRRPAPGRQRKRPGEAPKNKKASRW
ncbi:hypothetical protein JCM30197_03970 [Schleiferia thermophila]|nr:hypothetical protein JCM30197_03970 [Schleiferia thermophila]